MKFLADSMKDLERRMRLVENQKSQITEELDASVFKDCSEIKSNKSGVYKIKPEKSKKAFDVFCDMVTEGGGWTVSEYSTQLTYQNKVKIEEMGCLTV